MNPEQLSPEWVELTKKFELTKFDKIGFDELGSNYYQLRKDIIGDKFITDVANISALSSIDLLQHYQSKVVELIEAKIEELKCRAKKAERFETSSDLYRYAEALQILLIDLTNLKP